MRPHKVRLWRLYSSKYVIQMVTCRKELSYQRWTYQQQTDILAIRQSWRWDGFTSLVVDINASSSATFYFYPSECQPHSRPRGSVSRSRLRQPQCGAPRQGCSRTGCRRCSRTGIIFHKVTRRRRGNFFLAFSYFYSKIANNESLRIYRFQ